MPSVTATPAQNAKPSVQFKELTYIAVDSDGLSSLSFHFLLLPGVNGNTSQHLLQSFRFPMGMRTTSDDSVSIPRPCGITAQSVATRSFLSCALHVIYTSHTCNYRRCKEMPKAIYSIKKRGSFWLKTLEGPGHGTGFCSALVRTSWSMTSCVVRVHERGRVCMAKSQRDAGITLALLPQPTLGSTKQHSMRISLISSEGIISTI